MGTCSNCDPERIGHVPSTTAPSPLRPDTPYVTAASNGYVVEYDVLNLPYPIGPPLPQPPHLVATNLFPTSSGEHSGTYPPSALLEQKKLFFHLQPGGEFRSTLGEVDEPSLASTSAARHQLEVVGRKGYWLRGQSP